MLIEEIILENFMFYEYARYPFQQGVNLICGSNGSGKSSILLGVSITLVEIRKVDSRNRLILPADWCESEIVRTRKVCVIKRRGALKILSKRRVER